MKRTIEIRGVDCVDHEMALAFVPFTGMLYRNIALDEGLELVRAGARRNPRGPLRGGHP